MAGKPSKKRVPVSASQRWQVFARDNFTCVYCGAQAGQDGVSLAADHVISVADGGDSSMDNLVTACRKCNGGKGARSLSAAPATERSEQAAISRAEKIKAIAEASREATEARKDLEQQIVDIKCHVWGVDSIHMARNEQGIAANLVTEFGIDRVTQWYQSAYGRRVGVYKAIQYVCGCARNAREESSR